MKVKVLKESCIGCGACQAISSSTFELGDDGLAEVIVDSIAKEKEIEVLDAAESCPTGAIEVNTLASN
ncbi:MAG: ferredoxin [Bacilli bacterium]